MGDHNIGPWRSSDWQSFVALDSDLPMTAPDGTNALAGLLGVGAPFGGLAQAARAQHREKRVSAAWAARRVHPVYKALQQDLHFRQAWKVFERAHRRAREGKLAEDTAPFRFLHEYVQCAGWAFQIRGGSSGAKYGPHVERRRSAVKHADALSELLNAGISCGSYSETDTLRRLLQKLSTELQAMKRKPYGGARDYERSILKSLAHSLIAYVGLKSPAVVTHFARMVGVACEPKTAQRYCNEAAKQWAESMADALRRYTEKSAPSQGQISAAL